MSKIFCFAANGPILVEFRSENAHLALLNSAFRASFSPNRPHFRVKQKYLDMLLVYATEYIGDLTTCQKLEKVKIYNYALLPENLKRSTPLIRPPGNKVDS